MPPLITADTIRDFQGFLSDIQGIPSREHQLRAVRDACSLFQKLLDITETIEPIPRIRFWSGDSDHEYYVAVEIRRFVSDDYRQSLIQFTSADSKDDGRHVVTTGEPNVVLMCQRNNKIPLLRYLKGQLSIADQLEFDSP